MKKTKRKWSRVHLFKRKKSTRRQVGHPSYVYKTSGKQPNRIFKYLTITHNPEEGKESQYERLNHNIDPDDNKNFSYVKKRPGEAPENSFQDPVKNYRIHRDDIPIIKKYTK